jgi:hypothetical protein
MIEATRAAFADLLDEAPLAPDWQRATGQVVPLKSDARRSRRVLRLVATAMAVVVPVAAGAILLESRWDPGGEGPAAGPGVQVDVCDLFTTEEVTRIVRDAYVRVQTDTEMPTVLVEGTRGTGDSCDWHAPGDAWVILERIPDGEHSAVWSSAEFYRTRDDRTFEPHTSMPPGTGVANILVRTGYFDEVSMEADITVSIDVQVIDDAPQWWRFSMMTTYVDSGRFTTFEYAPHRLLAEDLAFEVAGQIFETIVEGP